MADKNVRPTFSVKNPGGEDATRFGRVTPDQLNENREPIAPGGSEVNPAAKWICCQILSSGVYEKAPRWLLLTAGL